MDRIIKHKLQKGAVLPIAAVIGSIAAITILFVWLLVWTKPQPEAKLQQLAPVKVVLAEVQKRFVQPYEIITGRLQPIKTAQARFEVAGKVVSRNIEPGTHVIAGTTLMQLDDSDYRDQLQQVAAELTIEQQGVGRDKNLFKFAQNNLLLQQQEEQRLQRLVERNLIAQSQLDSTRQRVFDLQAEVARLEYSVATNNARVRMKQAQHDIAKRNLERTKLVAPFDGVVNEVFIDEGDYVNANEVALTLADVSQFDVQLDVRGDVIAGLQLSQQVNVRINNIEVSGNIVALQLDPDVNTNTHQVRVRVPSKNVQSGLLAAVYMPLSVQSESVLIPVSAVLNQFGKSYAYSVENNVVNKIPILLGRRINNEVVVLDGLNVGQNVIARDVNSLIDQQQVTTE